MTWRLSPTSTTATMIPSLLTFGTAWKRWQRFPRWRHYMLILQPMRILKKATTSTSQHLHNLISTSPLMVRISIRTAGPPFPGHLTSCTSWNLSLCKQSSIVHHHATTWISTWSRWCRQLWTPLLWPTPLRRLPSHRSTNHPQPQSTGAFRDSSASFSGNPCLSLSPSTWSIFSHMLQKCPARLAITPMSLVDCQRRSPPQLRSSISMASATHQRSTVETCTTLTTPTSPNWLGLQTILNTLGSFLQETPRSGASKP